MSRHSRGLNQIATRWTATENGLGGWSFGDPDHIKCHWEDTAQEFVDFTGKTVVSKAIVYLAEDVAVGDFLVLGEFSAADPTTLPLTYQVRQFMRTPNLRNLIQERRAYL